VPVEPKTFRLTAAAVQPFINSSTALVVASAVSFPHGALDDVAGLGALCKARCLQNLQGT
jgi:sphinganine-1-phosphate aldolase